MKTSRVPFTLLRRILRDLNFTESREEKGWRFEHPESETVFLFRPYQPDEKVTVQDLVTTRTHLEWRGLLSAEAFENLLHKIPA